MCESHLSFPIPGDTKTETSDTNKGRASIGATVNGQTPEIRRDLNELLGNKGSALKPLLPPSHHAGQGVLTGNLIYHSYTQIQGMKKWPEDDTTIYTAHS